MLTSAVKSASKHSAMRKRNTELVIEIFRQNVSSTYKVGKRLNLSSGGAKKLVDDIADGGLITRVAVKRENELGRTPISYGINPYFCKIIIVNYADCTVSLVDFCGNVIEQETLDRKFAPTDEGIVDTANIIEDMVARHTEGGKLMAISVAYIGKFDAQYSDYFSGMFSHCTINIYNYFKERFEVEILFHNDLHFGVLAERRCGALTGNETSCCYMQIGRGVACAMLINDKPYLGAHGIAGEVGHNFTLGSSTETHIESFMDCEGAVRLLREALDSGRESSLPEGFTFEDIVEAYKNGDRLVREVLAKMARSTGCLIKNMVEFMDFDVILLVGPMMLLGEDYLNEIKAAVNKYNYQVAIKPAMLAEKGIYLGAFEAARDSVIEKFVSERIRHAIKQVK